MSIKIIFRRIRFSEIPGGHEVVDCGLRMLNKCIQRSALLKYLIISKLKLSKMDLLLGYFWWLLEPLILAAVYWVLVTVILESDAAKSALFILCGLIPFRALSLSIRQAATSIVGQFSIISQINFPRIFLPLSDIVVNHVKLIIGLILLIGYSLLYDIMPSVNLVYLIVPFSIQLIFVTGLGLLLSVVTVYFRDTKNFLQFILRGWLILSPVLYSIDRFPDSVQTYLLMNPMAPIIILYRDIIMDGLPPQFFYVFIGSMEAVLVFMLGYIIFAQKERHFLKLC